MAPFHRLKCQAFRESGQLGDRFFWAASGFRRVVVPLTIAIFVNHHLPVAIAGDSIVDDSIAAFVDSHCVACHDAEAREGGLDLTSLSSELDNDTPRDRWIRIHDRVKDNEMPPVPHDLSDDERAGFLSHLGQSIIAADRADIDKHGRGPMRRLNRDEYEQNLRDILHLPQLDIRDILPEDRLQNHFNKSAEALDMSRVQLLAYLDAADVALNQAIADQPQPSPTTMYRAAGVRLFPERSTFGEREAMFFTKDSALVEGARLEELADDPTLEMALFRSAHWPYYGYPKGFIAALPGEYRIRFSARAVVQIAGLRLSPAPKSVPMTFRARKPSGPDVSGDVRATGGLIDISPEPATYQTVIGLREGETFEYSLLGLPVPLARNVDGGPPTYRYPPIPEGGQAGVAFAWLEVEGPLPPSSWPPESHRVLFDDLTIPFLQSPNLTPAAKEEAGRLLRRFIARASREPVLNDVIEPFEKLVFARLDQGLSFAEAMRAGYKAFLCSSHFLYLREPVGVHSQFAIAERLSHFLTDTRPDETLARLATDGALRDPEVVRRQAERLIAGEGFDRFVKSFTDYWLDLRHIRRDDPDTRFYPEYRFDDYLVESMEREARALFASLIRDNLSVSVLVDADFVFVNDRLADHYRLPPMSGSNVRRVSLPPDSPYGGLITSAAILKVTSNGTSTSPVVRGAWVMDRLLGQPPSPPPASVPAVEPDIRGAKTIRELLALHTRSDSCAICHAKFDPVGLALESFDVFGSWRTHYRGLDSGVDDSQRVTGIDRAGHDFAYTLAAPVDPSGTLNGGVAFRDIAGLKAILADNPRQLARSLLQQFTIYATGTPVRFSEHAEIDAVLDACADGGYRAGDLLAAFVRSELFLGSIRNGG